MTVGGLFSHNFLCFSNFRGLKYELDHFNSVKPGEGGQPRPSPSDGQDRGQKGANANSTHGQLP